jgi:hypothetical protein
MPVAAIPSTLSILGGGLQAILGGAKARKAQNALEQLKTPTYSPNKSVNDYYQMALNKATAGPYNSSMYNVGKNNILNNQATAIGALQNRRSAVGNIGAINQQTNNSLNNLGVQAEQLNNQNFRTLGGATQMKAGDDRLGFQYNQLMPYQKQYSLLAQKASGGNQTLNAGLGNVFGGLSGLSQVLNATKNPFNQQQPYNSNQQINLNNLRPGINDSMNNINMQGGINNSMNRYLTSQIGQ